MNPETIIGTEESTRYIENRGRKENERKVRCDQRTLWYVVSNPNFIMERIRIKHTNYKDNLRGYQKN